MIVEAIVTLSLLAPVHDHWISQNGFRSPANAWSCGENDCFVVKGVKSTSLPTAGYRLPSGEFIAERDTLPSLDGQFWRCQHPDGKLRCFFVPPNNS